MFFPYVTMLNPDDCMLLFHLIYWPTSNHKTIFNLPVIQGERDVGRAIIWEKDET